MNKVVVLVVATILSTHAHAQDTPWKLTLTSPLDYQVFQRQTRTTGRITVDGHIDDIPNMKVSGFEFAQGRVLGKSATGDLPDKWQPLTIDVATHKLHGEWEVPAGGWYRIEIRIIGNGPLRAQAEVAHVGVGEVFVGAGQSNSTNYGAERQHPATGMVATFSGEAWRLADDPQPGTQDHSSSGSFWPAFGDAMFAKYGVPIGVAVTGAGSTSVREWLPKGTRMRQQPTTGHHVQAVGLGEWAATGELFDGLTHRLQQLGPHGCRAVLWHQGESDAGQARGGAPADRQITGDQYRVFMAQLIRAVRREANWDVPWFVAQATYHSAQDPADEEFRAAQRSLWQTGLALEGPDTDALGDAYRAGVHFNTRGLQAHGQAWADKVGLWLDKQLEAK